MPTKMETSASARPRMGIGLILLATAGIVAMNACARASSGSHGPVEMIFFRGLIALTLMVPYMLATRPLSVFTSHRIKTHLYRSVVGNLGVGLVFWAYSLLPMANATALLFAAPLFVTALSPLLLKERVDRTRWLAVMVGFCGTVMIVRPAAGMLIDPASLVGLLAALCIGLVDMALRDLGRTEEPMTTVFFFILGGVLLTAPYVVFFGSWPEGDLLYWMVGIGIFTAIQQLAKTAAFRFAEASFLAPYTYTAIVWAAAAGWLLWDEQPTLAVVIGSLVVIGSNLFLLRRTG